MRTFSALKALCAYPAELSRPSARRDAAAELGNEFHGAAEEWAASLDGSHRPLTGLPAAWMERLKRVWSPPEGIECEVPLGLAANPFAPHYVQVVEVEPHIYVPPDMVERWKAADPAGRKVLALEQSDRLLTAGRADWLWPTGEAINVCDVKTGQFYLGPPAEVRQVLAQGFAACERARAGGFRAGIYYARLGAFDWGPIIQRDTQAWAEAWVKVREAALLPAEPRPGGWCLSCWSKKDCRAYSEAA